jgi:hypothetical protein
MKRTFYADCMLSVNLTAFEMIGQKEFLISGGSSKVNRPELLGCVYISYLVCNMNQLSG